MLSGKFQLEISFLVDLSVVSRESIVGRDVPNGTVKPLAVVMLNEFFNGSIGIVFRQQHCRADALSLDRLVPAFDLAVALRIVWAGANMAHAAETNKILEVLGNKLLAVVGDDSRLGVWELLFRFLQHNLNVCFLHRLTDLAVDNKSAAAIKDAAHVIKRAADVHVSQINMPVIVRLKRLHESVAFLAGFGVPTIE